MFPHHTDQMCQGHRSQVSLFVFQNQKVPQWVSDKVANWAVCGQHKARNSFSSAEPVVKLGIWYLGTEN